MNIFRNVLLKEPFTGKYISENYRAFRMIPVTSFCEENQFFLCADRTIGVSIECQPLPGADSKVQERLNSLFNSNFPAGTLINTFWVRSPDLIRQMTEMSLLRSKNTITDPVMLDYIKDRSKFFIDGTLKPHDELVNNTFFDIRLYITAKIPIIEDRPDETEIYAINQIKEKLMGGLKTAGLSPVVVSPMNYILFLNPIINRSKDAAWRRGEVEYDPYRPICDQVFDYNTDITVEKSHIKIGDTFVRVLSAKRLPKGIYFGNALGYVGDLRGSNSSIKINYAISCNIHYLDPEADKKNIEKKRLYAVNQATDKLVNLVPVLGEKRQSFDLIYESMNEGFRPIKMSYSVILWCDDLERLQMETTAAQTLWREQRFDLMEDTFIQLPLFFNSLPMCSDPRTILEFFRYKTLTTQHAVPLLPLFSEWKGTGTPHVNLVSRNGQLMNFSLHDTGTNKNLVICATSGGGKSFFINELIMSYLSEGAKIWVIDVGRSYEKLCKSIGGQFIHFGQGSNICLNPFPIVVSLDGSDETRSKMLNSRELAALKNPDHKDDGEEDALVGLLSIMASENERLTAIQISELRKVLHQVWTEQDRNCRVQHIADALCQHSDQRISDVGRQLYAFTDKGSYGRYFNGKNNIDLNNQFTVLELEELKSRTHLQKVVLFQLIYQIQQEVYLGDRSRKKLILLDEGWDLICNGGDEVQMFIEHAYRRFRKYGASVGLISQAITDMYKSKIGEAIMDNTATLGLFRHLDESVDRLKNDSKLVLPEAAYNLLKTVHTSPGHYSEIFLKTEAGMGVGRLMVNDFSKLLYSTDARDVSDIKRWTDKGKDIASAIQMVLKDRGQRV